MKKIVVMLLVLIATFVFVVVNLGKWIDRTGEPVRSDLIVCLGGGDMQRLKRSIALYEEGYAKSDRILFTGDDITPAAKKKGFKDVRLGYIRTHHPNIGFLHNPQTSSTGEEVKFIKEYMLKHGYSSALIVTDPPHSARIHMLNALIDVEGDEALSFRTVASGVKWWSAEKYYLDNFARGYVADEVLKIIYNFVAYGILDKIGLMDSLKEWIKGK